MKKSEPPTDVFDALQIELENVHVNLRERLSRLTAVIDELREEDKKEQQLPVQDTRQDSDPADSDQLDRYAEVELEKVESGPKKIRYSPETPTGKWTFPAGPLKRKAITTKPLATQIWQSLFLLLAFSSLWAIGSLSSYRYDTCGTAAYNTERSCSYSGITDRMDCRATVCPSFIPNCKTDYMVGHSMDNFIACLGSYYSGVGDIKDWLVWVRFIQSESDSFLPGLFIAWMVISGFIFLLEIRRVPIRKLAYTFLGVFVVLATVFLGYSCWDVLKPMGFGTCGLYKVDQKVVLLAVVPWFTFVLWFIPRKKIEGGINFGMLSFPIATMIALLASW